MFAEIFEYNMLCFHLSLFNFQSAIRCLIFRDLLPRRDSLTIISHLFPFVKYFFKISWSFFKFFCFLLVSRRQLCYYITRNRICQALFQNFLKNLFSGYFPVPFDLSLGTWYIISFLPGFVNSHISLLKSYFTEFICTPRTAVPAFQVLEAVLHTFPIHY